MVVAEEYVDQQDRWVAIGAEMEQIREMLTDEQRKFIRLAQRTELTEYHIYSGLADLQKDEHNRQVFTKIAKEELAHYNFWKNISGQQVKPNRLLMIFYILVARIFGITFGIKLMERGEQRAEHGYKQLLPVLPKVQKLIDDENEHEQNLIQLLDEERLKYVSSMVLGLNDALVELIGALAGLTLALQKTSIVALAGLITGIAAAMSMAASEYLSIKAEESEKSPLRAAGYTGVAYIVTVVILIIPYLILDNALVCLAVSVVNSLVIILFFTYYISVAKDYSFRRRFTEMAAISLAVALLNFGIGLLIRQVFHIEV